MTYRGGSSRYFINIDYSGIMPLFKRSTILSFWSLRAIFIQNSKKKNLIFEMILAGFFQGCRSYCKLPNCPFPSKCMRSIHFQQLSSRFSVAQRAGEAMLPTVKGIPRKRSARPQISGGAGLSKLIMTSSGRASPRAFGELKGRKRIEMLWRIASPLPVVVTQASCQILSRSTAKGNHEQ